MKTTILFAILMCNTRRSTYIRQRRPFFANAHTKSLYCVPLRTGHRATSIKNYKIGQLAEGVLRGAKMVVVFERERLYRPPGGSFWSIWLKAFSEEPQSCSRSKTSAESKTERCLSKMTIKFAPLRTPSAQWPDWVPRGAIKLLSLKDDYHFQNGALSFKDDPPFQP